MSNYQTIAAAQIIIDKADKLNTERRALSDLTARLEERDRRSKWDWVTLGCAMIVAAGLAGAGAVYFTKQNLDTAKFEESISFIQNSDNAYWCKSAGAKPIQDTNKNWFCPVKMGRFQPPAAADAAGE